MNNIDEKIRSLLSEADKKGIFPGAAASIYINNSNYKNNILVNVGECQRYPRKIKLKSNTYFDLASLTKPLVTSLLLISLIDKKIINLNQKLNEFIPADIPRDKKDITILQLLNHSSGLSAHRPYFKQLAWLPENERPAEMLRLIMAEPLEYSPGSTCLYSDLGFILLGFLIEKVAGVGLDHYFKRKVAAPLRLGRGLFYNRLPACRRGSYAATEDCPWRGRVMRGQVSDENCWVLGGVAGHAGLFGRLDEVSSLVAALLEIWQGRMTHPFLSTQGVKTFLEAQSGVPGSTWGLGFDRPTPGGSSSGRYLSARSVGHLGFTGTSFWIDPDRDLAIVLLSNRVHPSRDNELIKEFRPYFHDRVIELLGLV